MMLIIFFVATSNTMCDYIGNDDVGHGACVYIPTVMTAVYTMAKQSSCTLRFHVATEGGWDAGGAAGLLVAAAATQFGLPLGGSILLSLASLAAVAVVLRRYYAERPPLTGAGE